MRDLIGPTFAGLFLLGAAAPALAEENPALADAEALCITNHAKADKVLSLADTQGWAKPPGAPEAGVRTKTLGSDYRTLVATGKSDSAGADPDSGVIQADVCVVTTKVAGPDIKAAARAYIGGQAPTADEGGGWIWVFTQSGQARNFLSNKEKSTLLAALKGGPVVIFATATGPDGDKVAYVELRQAPK